MLYNILFAMASVVGVVLSIFALAFNLTLSNPSTKHQRDTLQSWTCKFSHSATSFESDAKQLGIPMYINDGMTIPAGFKRLCAESEVSVGFMIALLVLELAGCTVAGFGILLERNMSKARQERYASNEKTLPVA